MIAAAKLLSEAAELVCGARARQHGDALRCHRTIARLWSAYLDRRLTATDAALLLLLAKVARSQSGDLNLDDFRDAAGYAALAGEISAREAADDSGPTSV